MFTFYLQAGDGDPFLTFGANPFGQEVNTTGNYWYTTHVRSELRIPQSTTNETHAWLWIDFLDSIATSKPTVRLVFINSDLLQRVLLKTLISDAMLTLAAIAFVGQYQRSHPLPYTTRNCGVSSSLRVARVRATRENVLAATVKLSLPPCVLFYGFGGKKTMRMERDPW